MSTDDEIFYPCKRVAFRKIGGTMVLVLPKEDRLISLNETATAIFERLEGMSVREIASCICEIFDIDPASALADVREFLCDMMERGIVELGAQRKQEHGQ